MLKSQFTFIETNFSRPALYRATFSIFCFILVVALTGCNYVKQLISSTPSTSTTPTKPGSPAGPGGAAPQGPGGSKAPPQAAPGQMDGEWKLAFTFNEQVEACHMRIKQNGDKFSGDGTDDVSGKQFLIENGARRKDQVMFYKRYQSPADPSQPPVEFTGSIDIDHGYMNGRYHFAFKGKQFDGDWEAQLTPPEPPPSQTPAQPAQQPPASQPSGPPDLSGKWNLGYEYQFKTMHSIMFLEQLYNGKITGHGVDENTSEKFTIEQGSYSYPKVTLVRKYAAIKTKQVTKPERRMTFKGECSWVNETDYQGAYLSGKTDGGGNWEAQKVR
ncbi:MAG: hypothetical protein K2X93_10225 [Candidatus Obscuribacterales bacterium]|nr:hypothetical protein [Candidatus Obscuribacterales bacterium]